MSTSSPTRRQPLERFAVHPRVLVVAGLLGATALCWAWIVPMARDMYGDMGGASAWMMRTGPWDAPYAAMMFAMWLAMMVGMMLPSAVPAALIFLATVRGGPTPQQAVARTYAFIGGYLLAWALFSALATWLQWAASELGALTPMLETRHAPVAALLLIAAGVYQWTPLKQACLTRCRSPMSWLPRNWKPGGWGALRMGGAYGLYCLGCCALLMLLLFAGGVMSLACIGAITIVVLIEKLAPFGRASGRVAGLALIAAGAALLLRA